MVLPHFVPSSSIPTCSFCSRNSTFSPGRHRKSWTSGAPKSDRILQGLWNIFGSSFRRIWNFDIFEEFANYKISRHLHRSSASLSESMWFFPWQCDYINVAQTFWGVSVAVYLMSCAYTLQKWSAKRSEKQIIVHQNLITKKKGLPRDQKSSYALMPSPFFLLPFGVATPPWQPRIHDSRSSLLAAIPLVSTPSPGEAQKLKDATRPLCVDHRWMWMIHVWFIGIQVPTYILPALLVTEMLHLKHFHQHQRRRTSWRWHDTPVQRWCVKFVSQVWVTVFYPVMKITVHMFHHSTAFVRNLPRHQQRTAWTKSMEFWSYWKVELYDLWGWVA